MTLSRSPATLADQDRRAAANGTRIIEGASGTAALEGRPSRALVRTKIAASAALPQQFFRRDVTTVRWLLANGAMLAKSLVYLLLFVLVSVITFICKCLILTVTYVIARLFPAEFDRDAVIDALSEVEKVPRLNDHYSGDVEPLTGSRKA